MLEKYVNIYPTAYKTISSEIRNKNISHAYMFEIGCEDDYEFIFDFLNEINNSGSSSNLFLDAFLTVSTDSKVIKKEQILEIKNNFSKTNLYGKYKIYLIKEANKLNDSSANTLLKFLEEPNDNILGVLVTNNIYNVIPTVLSRCQVISLKERKMKEELVSLKEFENVFNFLLSIEENKEKTIVYLENIFKDMEFNEIVIYVEKILYIYREVLNRLIDENSSMYLSYKEQIDKLIMFNNINTISEKINIALNILEESYTNINKNCLYDKLIIELSGGDNSVKC